MGASGHETSAGRDLFQSLEVYLTRSGYEAILSASSQTPPASGPETDNAG